MLVTLYKNVSLPISNHLHTKEFACRCNEEHDSFIDTKLIGAFEALRAEINLPLIVNSGYRCERHNHNVGGADHSQHKLAVAIDLTCSNLDLLERLAKKHFNYVIRYDTFVHMDLR